MVHFLQTLVINGRFDKIGHQLPMRGYSFLPCDRDFGVIEKLQRKRELVELYGEWEEMIKENITLISMTGRDMLDFKGHLQNFFKKSATKDGAKFSISKYKVFEYSAEHKYDVFCVRDHVCVSYE